MVEPVFELSNPFPSHRLAGSIPPPRTPREANAGSRLRTTTEQPRRPDVNENELPYTTEELDESTIAEMALPDQIRYAVYNGRDTATDVAKVTTYDEEWTEEMMQDLVLDGVLEDHGDGSYSLLDAPENEDGASEAAAVETPDLSELTDKQRLVVEFLGRHPDARETGWSWADVAAYITEKTGTEISEVYASRVARDKGEAIASYREAMLEADALDELPEEPPEAEPPEPEQAELADVEVDASEIVEELEDDDYSMSTAAPDGYGDDALEADEADPADVAEAREEHGGRLPVDRDYDWETETLDAESVPDYVSANGEYEDIMREIRTRDETGKLAHFRICGPSGCGKTSIAENAAVELDETEEDPVPVFEIQCHDGLRPSNLLGMPTYVGDETWWTDGPLTKALLSSREQTTFVILDEVNRTTARTLGVVMSALDHQCRVTLNSRGGEVIEGDPMNLVVFSTMNEGDGYITNQLDNAQVRRLGNTFYTDYIGMHDVDAEAGLIADRTPVSKGIAREMVTAANDVREKTQDKDSAVKMGVPTSTMLDWARTAWSYRGTAGSEGPLFKAAKRSVVNAFFRGDDNVKSTVETTIESHVRGMSLEHAGDDRPLEAIDGVGQNKADSLRAAGYENVGDVQQATQSELSEVEGIGNALAARVKADVGEAEEDEINASDATWLVCESCGWHAETEESPEEAVSLMECPDCAETILPKEDL